jgi:hypothetical protein
VDLKNQLINFSGFQVLSTQTCQFFGDLLAQLQPQEMSCFGKVLTNLIILE